MFTKRMICIVLALAMTGCATTTVTKKRTEKRKNKRGR